MPVKCPEWTKRDSVAWWSSRGVAEAGVPRHRVSKLDLRVWVRDTEVQRRG